MNLKVQYYFFLSNQSKITKPDIQMVSTLNLDILAQQFGLPDFCMVTLQQYQTCVSCNKKYSQDQLPLLLKCNHLICQNCYQRAALKNKIMLIAKCSSHNIKGNKCNKPLELQSKVFDKFCNLKTKINDFKKQEKPSQILCKFLVKNIEGDRKILESINVKGLTFQMLFFQHLKQMLKQQQASSIQGIYLSSKKAFSYQQVKRQKVTDKINLSHEKMNEITICKRYTGSISILIDS